MGCSVCGDPIVAKGMCDKHYRRLKLYGDPLAGRTPQGEAWRHVRETYLLPVAHDPGWPYTVAGPRKYGTVHVPNVGAEYVHVLSCTWAHGPRPSGMEVAHACRNTRCYWAEHLEWKTRSGNHADKIRDGTAWVGGQAVAVLDREQAAEILARAAAGESQMALSRAYGVGKTTIGRIIRGEHWTSS